MRTSQLLLVGEAVVALGAVPQVEGPLLQTALLIVGAVSVYSAFYLRERLGLHAAGYALSAGAVALFTLSDHPIGRFAGWEGVSVAAWALIAYGRGSTRRSLEAAFVGFAVNRLGDAFWLASLLSGEWRWGFVIGSWIKAALFPFSFWLIQAMYAPLPVSALLHSALLVALGVYGPIQNPAWIEGLPALWLRLGAEAAALGAALGAILSRVPKSALAWTTAAHLALVAAAWEAPPLAQKVLLTHACLKAALFLILGLVQKQPGWSLPLKLFWSVALGLLAFSPSPQAGLTALAAETLTAFALGRFWNAYPSAPFRTPLWPLFPPLFLIGGGAWHLLQEAPLWQVQGFVPLVGAGAGLLAPWPRRVFRLDKAVMRLFSHLERGWFWLACMCWRLEGSLLFLYDGLFVGGLRLMRFLARGEVQLIEKLWRPALRRVRQAFYLWIGFPAAAKASYQQALQWAFALTLILFAIWRYFF